MQHIPAAVGQAYYRPTPSPLACWFNITSNVTEKAVGVGSNCVYVGVPGQFSS